MKDEYTEWQINLWKGYYENYKNKPRYRQMRARWEANDIFDLATQLSLADMTALINCFGVDNIQVFVPEEIKESGAEANIDACLNGYGIQLNVYQEEDDD